MLFFDKPQFKERAEFISAVEKDPGGWSLLQVAATDPAAPPVVALARKAEAALQGARGALFAQDDKHMIACIKTGNSPEALVQALAAALPASGYAVTSSRPTPEDLRKMDARPAQGPDSARSTLYQHRAGRKENVTMIVDDDQMICGTLGPALKKYGECIVLQDAAGVVDTYLERSPDCVFLDSHLPGQSGLDLLELLLKYDRDAYVLMLTGDGGAKHAMAAKAKGAKSFLTKPIVLSRIEYELFQCPTFARYAKEREQPGHG